MLAHFFTSFGPYYTAGALSLTYVFSYIVQYLCYRQIRTNEYALYIKARGIVSERIYKYLTDKISYGCLCYDIRKAYFDVLDQYCAADQQNSEYKTKIQEDLALLIERINSPPDNLTLPTGDNAEAYFVQGFLIWWLTSEEDLLQAVISDNEFEAKNIVEELRKQINTLKDAFEVNRQDNQKLYYQLLSFLRFEEGRLESKDKNPGGRESYLEIVGRYCKDDAIRVNGRWNPPKQIKYTWAEPALRLTPVLLGSSKLELSLVNIVLLSVSLALLSISFFVYVPPKFFLGADFYVPFSLFAAAYISLRPIINPTLVLGSEHAFVEMKNDIKSGIRDFIDTDIKSLNSGIKPLLFVTGLFAVVPSTLFLSSYILYEVTFISLSAQLYLIYSNYFGYRPAYIFNLGLMLSFVPALRLANLVTFSVEVFNIISTISLFAMSFGLFKMTNRYNNPNSFARRCLVPVLRLFNSGPSNRLEVVEDTFYSRYKYILYALAVSFSLALFAPTAIIAFPFILVFIGQQINEFLKKNKLIDMQKLVDSLVDREYPSKTILITFLGFACVPIIWTAVSSLVTTLELVGNIFSLGSAFTLSANAVVLVASLYYAEILSFRKHTIYCKKFSKNIFKSIVSNCIKSTTRKSLSNSVMFSLFSSMVVSVFSLIYPVSQLPLLVFNTIVFCFAVYTRSELSLSLNLCYISFKQSLELFNTKMEYVLDIISIHIDLLFNLKTEDFQKEFDRIDTKCTNTGLVIQIESIRSINSFLHSYNQEYEKYYNNNSFAKFAGLSSSPRIR